MDKLDLSEIENRWNKAFPLIQMGCFSKGCSVGYGFVVNDEFESKYAPASQEFIDNAPMDISALVLEVKRLRQDRAEVRRDALLDVCKMQCWMCEENKELAPGKEFNHKMNGWLAECHAHDVRRMIAAEQGKESK